MNRWLQLGILALAVLALLVGTETMGSRPFWAPLLLGSLGAIAWGVAHVGKQFRPARPLPRSYALLSGPAQTLGIMVYTLGQLALMVGAIYIVVHFVTKYW